MVLVWKSLVYITGMKYHLQAGKTEVVQAGQRAGVGKLFIAQTTDGHVLPTRLAADRHLIDVTDRQQASSKYTDNTTYLRQMN